MRLLGSGAGRYWPAAAGLVLIALFARLAQADQLTLTQTVGGLMMFLTLDPADAVARDPMHELERKMHHGSKPGGRTYHVQLELFEEASGARTTDVEQVSAFVVDGHGRSPPEHMQWMVREGHAGWGSYLDFGDSGPYEIGLMVQLKRSRPPLAASFRFPHLPP